MSISIQKIEDEIDPWFSMTDWEYALDTLQEPTLADLANHLQSAPAGNETAKFLKEYLLHTAGFTLTSFDQVALDN